MKRLRRCAIGVLVLQMTSTELEDGQLGSECAGGGRSSGYGQNTKDGRDLQVDGEKGKQGFV
jgi:hypothetical protein